VDAKVSGGRMCRFAKGLRMALASTLELQVTKINGQVRGSSEMLCDL